MLTFSITSLRTLAAAKKLHLVGSVKPSSDGNGIAELLDFPLLNIKPSGAGDAYGCDVFAFWLTFWRHFFNFEFEFQSKREVRRTRCVVIKYLYELLHGILRCPYSGLDLLHAAAIGDTTLL